MNIFQTLCFTSLIHAVYYIKSNYITDTYMQKYDSKFYEYFIIVSHVLMSVAVFIASSQVRFRLRKSYLIMLDQVDVGLPRGRWYGALAKVNVLFTSVDSSALITFPNHFNLYVDPFCGCGFSVYVLIEKVLLSRFRNCRGK